MRSLSRKRYMADAARQFQQAASCGRMDKARHIPITRTIKSRSTQDLLKVGRTGRALVIAGALCMIAGLEFFVAEAIAASGWPGYSYSALDVSLLGAVTCAPDAQPGEAVRICSPLHAVMNAGFVLVGLLHLAGIALTWNAWPKAWLTWIGLSALAAGAVGAILVGLAPLDQSHGVHIFGAALGLLIGNLGLAVLGLSLMRRAPAFGALSLVSGVVALAGFALYRNESFLGLGRGGTERVAAYPETLWYAVAGVVLVVAALREPAAKIES